MSRFREYLCVVKLRGLAPAVICLREGYEHEALPPDPAVVCRPFDGRGTQQIAFHGSDDTNGLCGPLLVTGVDAKGERRSLEPIEAQMVLVQLRERCRASCVVPCARPEGAAHLHAAHARPGEPDAVRPCPSHDPCPAHASPYGHGDGRDADRAGRFGGRA